MLAILTNLLFSFLLFSFATESESREVNPSLAEPQITFQDVVSRFDENDLEYVVLPLQGEAVIVVSEYGGRILGPFPSKTEPGIYWINPIFGDKDAFKEFISAKEWNVGGDRIWIAPEIQYNVPDRGAFWESYSIPPAVDPGNYQIRMTDQGNCTLSQSMVLEAYNIGKGKKELLVERTISKAANPIRFLSKKEELMREVTYIGYQQQVDLSETKADDLMTEIWDLVQLKAEGRMIIPSSPLLEYIDYFDPMPEDYHRSGINYNEFRITGKKQYKVGLKAAHILGRPSYFSQLPDGRAYLVICNFFNNPSSVYSEEPPALVGKKGQSIHIYNDDGSYGGFAELECNGQTIGGSTGRSTTSDQLVFWIYIGQEEQVKQIAQHLLGVSL